MKPFQYQTFPAVALLWLGFHRNIDGFIVPLPPSNTISTIAIPFPITRTSDRSASLTSTPARFQLKTEPRFRDEGDDGNTTTISSASDSADLEPASSSVSTMLSMAPLLTLLLREGDGGGTGLGASLSASSNGLSVWKVALKKGRLPLSSDFMTDGAWVDGDNNNNGENNGRVDGVWPVEPLFSHVSNAMANLQLPRLVLRHPDTVEAVLLTLIRIAIRFEEEIRSRQMEEEEEEEEEEEDDDLWWEEEPDAKDKYLHDYYGNNDDIDNGASEPLSEEELEGLAEETVKNLVQQWEGVAQGSNMLDYVYGRDNGLFMPSLSSSDGNEDGGPSDGFGLQDGVWRRTGWTMLPALQSQIDSMGELKRLLSRLGRRPTADPPANRGDRDHEKKNRLRRFPPRVEDKEGGMGALRDVTARDSVDGVGYSGRLGDMLLSEAVLLRASNRVGRGSGASDGDAKANNTDTDTVSPLRLLFLAKLAESKLLSYRHTGFTDVPSVPLPHRRPIRTPSAPGGPILLCLDTSYSMSTPGRERLSKAVVVACVKSAIGQGRECQVVAFSNRKGLMECERMGKNGAGVEALLNFLEGGFEGGGTDVTGALEYAMERLGNGDGKGGVEEEEKGDRGGGEDVLAGADILLVTDGEIPDPPVSDKIMQELEQLKVKTGAEVHGLLVGRSESRALERICTEVHNFLDGYDDAAIFGALSMNVGGGSAVRTY